MQIYFMRHGKAGDKTQWTGPDEQRPLTDEGCEEMRVVAHGLRRLDLKLDAVLSSPLVRARQTADSVAEALGLPVTEAPELAPGCDLDRLAAALRSQRSTGAILVVGHEPDFSTLVGQLISKRGAMAEVELKKAACCRVDVSGTPSYGDALAGHGTLVWLLPPKVLALLGAGEG